MAYLSQIEAALFLGLKVETVEYLATTCPKKDQQRTLKFINSDAGKTYDEVELESYRDYLNEPWPLPKSGKRPGIPKAIRDDVKEESHHSCAICGHMDNGEIAHIEAVATTLNNAPGNLIYLCPNHHAKYDLGFKVSSNITAEEIKAAKLLKQNARRRVMKYEALATKSLISLIGFVRTLQKSIASAETENIKVIHLSELTSLLATVPELTKAAQAEAKADKLTTKPEKALVKIAPKLAAIAAAVPAKQSEKAIRAKANELISNVEDFLVDLDEVECPHCSGRGLTGLAGDFCRYCRGSCFVSHAKHSAYDPDDIDEVKCPRCDGRGITGLVSDLCAYCRGSCVVSHAKADNYEPDEIDEVDCPRCDGKGTTGLVGDFCAFCKGSCVVSREKCDEYDPERLDEVACPRCDGEGTTGLVGDYCAYCKGSCFVSKARCNCYDPDDIDQVECPRCNGKGTTGWVGDYCKLCKGSCLVSSARATEYQRKYGR
jgi:DnaJ-class molecular chaperone